MTSKFDVDFPMFSKIEVNGENEAELYSLLKSQQPGEGESPAITWNFEKFLVNGNGDVVKRWAPPTTPEDISAELDRYR